MIIKSGFFVGNSDFSTERRSETAVSATKASPDQETLFSAIARAGNWPGDRGQLSSRDSHESSSLRNARRSNCG